MSEDISPQLSFLALYDLDIRLHAFLGERTSEQIGDVSVRVQTAEL
jgi:hypothetical protein